MRVGGQWARRRAVGPLLGGAWDSWGGVRGWVRVCVCVCVRTRTLTLEPTIFSNSMTQRPSIVLHSTGWHSILTILCWLGSNPASFRVHSGFIPVSFLIHSGLRGTHARMASMNRAGRGCVCVCVRTRTWTWTSKFRLFWSRPPNHPQNCPLLVRILSR